MSEDLEHLTHKLARAKKPEDVFGPLEGRANDQLLALKKQYHCLAKISHPDVYLTSTSQFLAQQTFSQLTLWFKKAQARVEAGKYGTTSSPETIIVCTKTRDYCIEPDYLQDGIYNLYACEYLENDQPHRGTLKIVRDPHNNSLAENEIRILKKLMRGLEAAKFTPYLPNLIEAFGYQEGGSIRQAAIFEKLDGWYSLAEVHQYYPCGIDPKDMAWMWRRLLVVLGFVHLNGIVHGAVAPQNIWIQPEKHGLLLQGWSRAVEGLADPDGSGWYPNKGESASSRTDIVLSAKCMFFLLGGDLEKGYLPDSIPPMMKAFFRGCILPGKRAPQDAWALKKEFDELIEKLWGERKFHPFFMYTDPFNPKEA
jgi:serine/threonine protein kinase